ncbi:MAG: DNA translocase FtsK 4TM domain-containing protein [bacterium]|nr:DNA translocase FtsK 4TM domain-containing protein [bacterium]
MKFFPELEKKTKNEIVGIILFFCALIILLSLATYDLQYNWIGLIGDFISRLLFFIFGNYVAFVIPILLFLWGVSKFKQAEQPTNITGKLIGGILVIISLCTLLSLPYAGVSDNLYQKQKNFDNGGIIGAFITSGYPYSLQITRLFGTIGAYLLASMILVIGTILSTEFLFSEYVVLAKNKLQTAYLQWREKRKAYKSAHPLIKPTLQPQTTTPPSPPQVSPPPKITVVGQDKSAKKGVKPEKPIPAEKPASKDGYQLPPIDLLQLPTGEEESRIQEEILQESKNLEDTLLNFGIEAKVVEVSRGPVVTRYELQPAPGVKISSITSLQNDISLAMKAHHIRIVAPIPGKAAVGIEIPNRTTTPVLLREILDSEAFRKCNSKLALALGKTIDGEPYVADLAKMPHLLVAGTTGSGKSVCINAMIASILYNATPDEVKFIMIDPKRVELSMFSEIPHLLTPVVTEAKKACLALKWAVREMERRYNLFADVGVRDITGYNALYERQKSLDKNAPDLLLQQPMEKLPLIVIIIDELADLMMVARTDNEDLLTRLAQMARAVGIHLVLATQRPSVDVITGLIKANFPSRIAFQVSTKIDSRTILDGSGAEALLGRGDMLFSPGGTPKPYRLQGSFISDAEMEKLTEFIRNQRGPDYAITSFSDLVAEETEEKEGVNGISDALYEEAVRIVRKTRQASASMLQTQLGIGYPRARKLIEQMERDGIVGPMRGSKPREILLPFDDGS